MSQCEILLLIIAHYYKASSPSGQNRPNCALWLATREGKMELSYPLGTNLRAPREKSPRKPNNKSFIDQVCSAKMAGYWPRSYRSINTQIKNTWPIQPSWPHTWSITHTYCSVLNIDTLSNQRKLRHFFSFESNAFIKYKLNIFLSFKRIGMLKSLFFILYNLRAIGKIVG